MDAKFSSKAKTLTQTIKKLNTSWSHSNEQIVLLLENLLKLVNTMGSVEKTQRSKILETTLSPFPTIFEQLFGSLMIEIEDNCLQIKQFMTTLGDIDAAMKQASLECSQLLHEKRVEEVIGPNGQSLREGNFTNIDAMETILEVQRLQFSRSYDYQRKEELLLHLFLPSFHSSSAVLPQRKYEYWMSKDTIALTLQQWDSLESAEAGSGSQS